MRRRSCSTYVSVSSVQSKSMASTSASAGSSTPAFVTYTPPTSKLPLRRDKRYDVFLSFRGPDVRKTLVDHLYEALSAAGLNVFLDTEKLEKGEIIDLGLERAMEDSAIRIPVFSKGYADSVWCLKEAAAMVKTPGLIIPLFYYVDPTHVRYPLNDSSPYKQSFLKHYNHSDRYPRKKIDCWKHALQQICSHSGWSMDVTQGFEARLVKKVVHDLIQTLDRVPLEVAKHPVGVHSVKNALIQELHLNSVNEVVKVGIWGIGGIGKTTIAKALYNQLYVAFEAASFVFNVHMIAADPKGLRDLQKKILKDLCKYGGEVDSIEEGKSLLRDRLGGKNVLLIVDDVDDVEHLDALVGDWLASNSRVILTSRDRHILNVAQVQCIHEMSGLDINEGLNLFSWHTFLRPYPIPSYKDLSKGIVEACKGHPLSLEVIGSFLYDKKDDIGCWTEAFHNITLHPGIHERLKISYNGLSVEEKEIFLDIACFFIGEVPTHPIVFWKSLYKMVDTALFNLLVKSLIKIDDKGLFYMHDHLRDMGWTIAETEKKGTRLWEANHLSNLNNNTNCSRLRLKGSNPQKLETLYSSAIRYLHLHDLSIEDMTKDTLAMLPPSLIWLRLEYCTLAIGMNRAAKKPRRSKYLSNNWQLKIMELKCSIDLDVYCICSLLSLPNLQLQYLDLSGCQWFSSLPDTIGNLSQLYHLDLSWCTRIKILPDTIGNLLQLQYLNLSGCQGLKFLPDAIRNLSYLRHLDLSYCEGNILCDTIGTLSQLQYLNLEGCEGLIILPDIIGNLSQLQYLNLEGCEGLNTLPDTIGNLSQLQHLNLRSCGGIHNLPDTIDKLSQLQHLNLRGCGGLNILPNTIGKLSQLQHLNLNNCVGLNALPDTIGILSQLEHLDLRYCGGLNILPNTIGTLSKLQRLNLSNCGGLLTLPDTIVNLSQLQHLNLSFCGALNILPDIIGKLSQLQHLDLRDCGGLNILPDTIGNLSQLEHLNLSNCGGLHRLPNTIGNLSHLQHLNLSFCGGLHILPDTICKLSQLKHLDLRDCGRLNILPDAIGNLSQLQHLNLSNCGRLHFLPDTIGHMSHLQYLNLSFCGGLHVLPHTIGNLLHLQHLNLSYCASLRILPDTIGNFGKLSQMQHLNLKGCGGLHILCDTFKVSQLQHLDSTLSIVNCPHRIGNLLDEHSRSVYTLP